MAPMLSARERDLLDYLCREAEDRLIAGLPSARLRVLAQVTLETPRPVVSWKGDA